MRHRIQTLVVDDSSLLRDFLVILLNQESGFEVVGTAADGLEAIQCLSSLHPELIVMDVNMPQLDGIAATRLIKQSPHPPVIVLVTADFTAACRAEAEDAGADGFVSKSEHLPTELKSVLNDLFSPMRIASRSLASVSAC
jgi:CheY-like chemotaxis protein